MRKNHNKKNAKKAEDRETYLQWLTLPLQVFKLLYCRKWKWKIVAKMHFLLFASHPQKREMHGSVCCPFSVGFEGNVNIFIRETRSDYFSKDLRRFFPFSKWLFLISLCDCGLGQHENVLRCLLLLVLFLFLLLLGVIVVIVVPFCQCCHSCYFVNGVVAIVAIVVIAIVVNVVSASVIHGVVCYFCQCIFLQFVGNVFLSMVA